MVAFKNEPKLTQLTQFMHTPQGRYKDDVAGDIRSYQWANVKRIDPAQKINNADNLMYFALGM
jgi:hypothetical protein